MKAKEGRNSYQCEILKKEKLTDDFVMYEINVTHKLATELVHPGSFVFLKKVGADSIYDVPISIMDVDTQENIIKVVVELRGVKTKSLYELDAHEPILVKGPYWNGVFGLKSIYKAKEGVSIVIARGIGQAPLVPVLKKLHTSGNKIVAMIDTVGQKCFIEDYLAMANAQVINLNTIKNGELSEELVEELNSTLSKENVNLIHMDSQDILIYKLLEYIDGKVPVSCCNNARMCCGEGVCGACTARYSGHVVKRLCKMQSDPEYVFMNRRFI